MGLDGGTKITRSDVLRGQSWRMAQSDTSRSTRGGSVNQVYQEKQLDPETRRAILWSYCALSGLALAAPLVCDEAGQLMNRQAVLEHLLAARSVLDDAAAQLRYSNQQRAGGAFDHIQCLKDVFTVNLTNNPELQQQQQGVAPAGAAAAAATGGSVAGASSSQAVQDSSSGSSSVPQWVCPVTLLPCGGKQPFSALKPCGHVVSDKALAALKTVADKSCPVCGAAFSSSDVVQVNGSPEHMEAVRQRLTVKAAAKAAAKAARAADGSSKQKKRGHLLLEQDGSNSSRAIEAAGLTGEKPQQLLLGSAAAAAASSAWDVEKQQQTQHKAPRLQL